MINIAGIEAESVVDGEGWRFAIFTQGCKHHCKNCHNPQTWDMCGGTQMSIDELVDTIEEAFKENILMDGVTLTGGDPLYQPDATFSLCKKLKDLGINIWLYTGFTYEEITKDEKLMSIMKYIDVLVDGPFIESLKSLELEYRGSSNQRILDMKKTLESGKPEQLNLERE